MELSEVFLENKGININNFVIFHTKLKINIKFVEKCVSYTIWQLQSDIHTMSWEKWIWKPHQNIYCHVKIYSSNFTLSRNKQTLNQQNVILLRNKQTLKHQNCLRNSTILKRMWFGGCNGLECHAFGIISKNCRRGSLVSDNDIQHTYVPAI